MMVALTPTPTTGLVPTAAQWQGWFDQTAVAGGGGGGLAIATSIYAMSNPTVSPTQGQLVYLESENRNGLFEWFSTNLSSQVVNDPAQALYVAAGANPSLGLSGNLQELSLGGTYYLDVQSDTGDSITVNTGGSAFAAPLSSGFAAYGAAVTFNPSDKSAGVTLSGGNLTMTGSGEARVTAPPTTNKFHVEFTTGSTGWSSTNHGVGLSLLSHPLNNYLGGDGTSAGLWSSSNNGNFLYNGGVPYSLTGSRTYGGNPAQTFALEWDLTAGLWWFWNVTKGPQNWGVSQSGSAGAWVRQF